MLVYLLCVKRKVFGAKTPSTNYKPLQPHTQITDPVLYYLCSFKMKYPKW